MANYNFTDNSITAHDVPPEATPRDDKPYYRRAIIDFSKQNLDAGDGDVARVINIPASTIVHDVFLRVITAETSGATCNLGYGSDTNYWGNAIRLDATGMAPTLIEASSAWDVGSIADGNEAVTEVTVDSAILGDYVTATSSLDVVDLALRAQVTATNTVTVQFENSTGAALDVGTPTIKVLVDKAPYRRQPLYFSAADTIDMVCNSSPSDIDWDALKVEVIACMQTAISNH